MEESLLECGVRMPSRTRLRKAKEFMKIVRGAEAEDGAGGLCARDSDSFADAADTGAEDSGTRIGSLGIGTIPNETYGSTGLYIKEQSPLKETFVVELANGAKGYIPPPELHPLGAITLAGADGMPGAASGKEDSRARAGAVGERVEAAPR